MATSTLLTLKRRKSLSKYAGEIMDKEILDALRGEVARLAKREYAKLVQTWSTKPKFVVRAGKSSAGRFFWNVRVEGGIEKDRWLMVDTLGRRGGAVIQSQDVGVRMRGNTRVYSRKKLRFREYYPKTLPRTPTSGFSPKARTSGPPGTSSGGRIGRAYYKDIIYQGAVEPRRFTELVVEPVVQEEFVAATKRAYNRVRQRFVRGTV